MGRALWALWLVASVTLSSPARSRTLLCHNRSGLAQSEGARATEIITEAVGQGPELASRVKTLLLLLVLAIELLVGTMTCGKETRSQASRVGSEVQLDPAERGSASAREGDAASGDSRRGSLREGCGEGQEAGPALTPGCPPASGMVAGCPEALPLPSPLHLGSWPEARSPVRLGPAVASVCGPCRSRWFWTSTQVGFAAAGSGGLTGCARKGNCGAPCRLHSKKQTETKLC